MIDRVQTGADYVRRWPGPGGRRRDRTKADDRPDLPDAEKKPYYGVPPIHRSHWRWPIALYFFLGGISGASYVLSAIAQLTNRSGNRQIVRAGRYVSIATLIPGTIILIIDLGRPERFLNMFRVIKFRSPMSLGSWGLGVFGIFSTAMTARQMLDDGVFPDAMLAKLVRKLTTKWFAALGTIPAFFVSGYTGVLLGATAVPLWARNALLMGPLFVAASMSSAVAAIKLVVVRSADSCDAVETLDRMERVSLIVEASLLAASFFRLGSLRRPATTGRNGRLLGLGTVVTGIGLPVVIDRINAHRHNRFLHALTSLCVLLGGWLMRFVVVDAGNRSADDPAATFEFTRRKG